MNRHGYKVRKFGRKKDQRSALLKGLANELILNGSIETTLPKAKATLKYTEKLISKAKRANNDLHARRQLINSMTTKPAAHKLVDEISPKLTSRNSGHLTIKRTTLRRGDGVQMARITFVDDIKAEKPKPVSKKTEKVEKEADDNKESRQASFKPEKGTSAQPKQIKQAAKRTGRRGNR